MIEMQSSSSYFKAVNKSLMCLKGVATLEPMYLYLRVQIVKNTALYTMKKFVLLFSALMYVGLVWAQQPDATQTPAENPESTGGPIMKLDSDVVDYGSIEYASDPLRTLSFKNTGTEPLVISNAKGSCGCTIPTWPREPILPGEVGQIEIRYDTKRPGPINKTVKITTNEAVNTHTVRVIGTISPKPAEEEALPKKEGTFSGGEEKH